MSLPPKKKKIIDGKTWSLIIFRELLNLDLTNLKQPQVITLLPGMVGASLHLIRVRQYSYTDAPTSVEPW